MPLIFLFKKRENKTKIFQKRKKIYKKKDQKKKEEILMKKPNIF